MPPGGTSGAGSSPSGPGTTTPPLSSTLPAGSDPPPVGKPFQIKNVTLANGYRSDDKFTIRWSISGDESSVLRYIVALRVLRPEQKKPYLKRVLQVQVATGIYEYSGTIDSLSLGGSQGDVGKVDKGTGVYDFLVPEVVALPKDSSKTPHARFGAARSVFHTSKKMPLLRANPYSLHL